MTSPEASPTPVRRPRRTGRWIVRGLALIVGALLLYEAGRVLAFSNQHTVIPGKVYRSAQPSPSLLREMVARDGIRTVVNLRGLCEDIDWYQGQCRIVSELGISQEDICLSANTLPPPSELRRLVEVLDRTEYPILIHCRRGADRTGLVSTMSLLLYTDATVDEARRQLLPRYGHFRVSRTAALDDFFDKYEDWLNANHSTHSPAVFRNWVLNIYCPGPARSRLTWIDPPTEVQPANRTTVLRVRADNLSDTDWQLKPGTFAGIHLAYAIYDEAGETMQYERTGLRFETVPPGGHTEFQLVVKALKPGRYTVSAELHDATEAGVAFRTNSFVKLGDGSLVMELVLK